MLVPNDASHQSFLHPFFQQLGSYSVSKAMKYLRLGKTEAKVGSSLFSHLGTQIARTQVHS